MSHEFPLVSVIIPVYNAASFLVDSIESILNQSYQNFELIIIDDCSSDNSLEIIYHYQKKDSRVIVMNDNENKGIPFRRNQGWKIAKGKYVLHLDHDDIALPFRLKKQVDFMEQNQSVLASGTYIQYIGNKNDIWQTSLEAIQNSVGLLFFSTIANPSSIFRKDSIDKYNILHNEKYKLSSDYDIWVQLDAIGELRNIPEIMTLIRKYENNASLQSHFIEEESMEIQQKILKENLNIDANKEELNLHYAITKPNCSFDLIKINDWLQKIYEANKIQKYYPDKELYSLLQQIWLKHFAGKIFDNQQNYTIFIHSTLSPYQNYSFFQKTKILIKYYWLHFGSKIPF